MKLDFKKMFHDYAEKNQKVFTHDRTKTLGASEVFGCIRRAKKHGVEKNDEEQSWGATARGDLIEQYHVVPILDSMLPEKSGYIGAGTEQKTFVDMEKFLSATPDGLIDGLDRDALQDYGIDDIDSDCIVTEIKSIDPRVNLTEEKAIHRGQVIIQMGLIRAQTEFKPMYALIMYFDASFLDKMSFYVVKFDEDVYEQAGIRSTKVFTTNDPSTLRAEGKLNNGCDFCQFTTWCSKLTEDSMPPLDTSSDSPEQREAMKPLAEEYSEVSSKVKALEARKDDLKEQIKDKLRVFKKRKVSGDKKAGESWSVSYSFTSGRETLDKGAMAADGIDLSQYMKTGDGFDRLSVTFKE
jgi:hypothetical protein